MDPTPHSPGRIQQSVIAVPPLARDDEGVVSQTENAKMIRHLETGGVNLLLYGGNAMLYHVRLSEYASILEMLSTTAADTTGVVPAVGPAFGMMMDQAAMLREHAFPTAMILPQRDIADAVGIVRGVRAFADALGKPVVLYLKFPRWLPIPAVRALVEEGLVSWIKYAVVREDPAQDEELRELVDAVPPNLIISGIGEQPAIVHMHDFGVAGFTSGCVCIAPSRSMEMLAAIRAGRWDDAEAIRARFAPLEDLRNEINPIRVLHAAVASAGIARTGPIPPLLSELSEEQSSRVAVAADKLLSWERSAATPA